MSFDTLFLKLRNSLISLNQVLQAVWWSCKAVLASLVGFFFKGFKPSFHLLFHHWTSTLNTLPLPNRFRICSTVAAAIWNSFWVFLHISALLFKSNRKDKLLSSAYLYNRDIHLHLFTLCLHFEQNWEEATHETSICQHLVSSLFRIKTGTPTASL